MKGNQTVNHTTLILSSPLPSTHCDYSDSVGWIVLIESLKDMFWLRWPDDYHTFSPFDSTTSPCFNGHFIRSGWYTRISYIRRSWYLLSSSHDRGLAFMPLPSAGGDQSLYQHSHWVLCSTAMCMELSLVPTRQPVQLPGTADSLHTTSESLLQCLLLYDIDLSCPHCVQLQTWKDFGESGKLSSISVHSLLLIFTYT